MMARWTDADMKSKRLALPAELDELISEDTDRPAVETLWAAMRSCYPTEDAAVVAATRNTGTILPYLNSPSNIRGSYDVLVDMLGREAATEICVKNPGILQCNPLTLAQEKPESIIQAADFVDFFENGLLGSLPTAVRQNLDKIAFIVLFIPVYLRLQSCAGATCGL